MKKLLDRIDLNLLRALNVMLEERSVTRAADRLFVSQSAMSKSLHRLRELLDDPLFVRSPHGLQPTTRAVELTEPLQQIFERIESCLISPHFDPALAHGHMRIAAPEQLALAMISQLLMRFRDVAPKLRLETQHLMDDHLEKLATGNLDFVIGLDQLYPDGYSVRRIYSASPYLWCRKHHPLAKKRRIGLSDISAYPQITFRSLSITQDVFRTIERIFAEANLYRESILDTNHLLIALDVLMKTDALMLAPDYLSRLSMLEGEIIPLSIDNITAFDRLRLDLTLVQHERTLKSPLHQWVAEEIAKILLAANTSH